MTLLTDKNNIFVKDSEEKYQENEEKTISEISQQFHLKDLLGEGVFGKVYCAYSVVEKRNVALKLIKKDNLSPYQLQVLRDEEIILSQMSHPNIIGLYMSKETKKHIVIAQELAEGSNLKQLFDQKSGFSENSIREIIKNLLNGLNYIHSNRIIHRDIKPENIVINLDGESLKSLKIIDFGLSFQKQGRYFINEIVGTPIYFAPELLQKKSYGQLIDIWSCGIVLYMLFSEGKHPFYKDSCTSEVLLDNIVNFRVTMPSRMDSKAFDLFKKMCCIIPEERYDANNALNHPWITGKQEIIFSPLEKIRVFNNYEKLLELIKGTLFLSYILEKSEKTLKPLKPSIKVKTKVQTYNNLDNSLSLKPRKGNSIHFSPEKARLDIQIKPNYNSSPANKKYKFIESLTPNPSKANRVSLKLNVKNSFDFDDLNLSCANNYSNGSSLISPDTNEGKSTKNMETNEMISSSISCDILRVKKKTVGNFTKLPQIQQKQTKTLHKIKSMNFVNTNEVMKLPQIQKTSKFKFDIIQK